MHQTGEAEHSQLDEILIRTLTDNQGHVAGLFRNAPGSWGFLAGQGVLGYKQHLGRSLTDIERRLVWDRLWWWLNQIRTGPISKE